jgi:hypothetical protein
MLYKYQYVKKTLYYWEIAYGELPEKVAFAGMTLIGVSVKQNV